MRLSIVILNSLWSEHIHRLVLLLKLHDRHPNTRFHSSYPKRYFRRSHVVRFERILTVRAWSPSQSRCYATGVSGGAGRACIPVSRLKRSTRLLLPLPLLLSLHQTAAPRIRLLLRDESDAGVASVTLNLRTESGQIVQIMTDATGIAVSNELAGKTVWLISGRRADGTPLVADSEPAQAGFRLVLLPGQARDVLLRLDGDRIVLDPDMIFSPGDPGEIAPPTPAQLAATVAPFSSGVSPIAGVPSPHLPAGANAAIAPPMPTAGESAQWIVLGVLGAGAVLVVLALLVGLARRRRA